jgi:putative transposase
MPWTQASAPDMRLQFIADYHRSLFSFADLCRRYGISRKTGYKWVERYQREGPTGLLDRTHRTRACPHATPAPVCDALLELRRKFPTWGAEKLLTLLSEAQPSWPLPSISTAHEILKRGGLVKRRRRRTHFDHPGRPATVATEPNAIWTTDFKGEFRNRDHRYCYPLTVLDLYSRFLLDCRALPNTSARLSRPVFEKLFREYGLPLRIRSDNGSPFAAHSRGRLSRLSVWWVRLGIVPELIQPAKPQQNGAHERMHRTLKGEATRPPKKNLRAQQRRFDEFRNTYNTVRPHKALHQKRPANLYQPSPRPFPKRLPPLEYPDHFEVRRVSANSCIRWKGQALSVSAVLAGEHVALEAVDNDLWDLYFGPVRLGRLDDRTFTITDDDATHAP